MRNTLWCVGGFLLGVGLTLCVVTGVIAIYDAHGLLVRFEQQYHHIRCIMIPK